MSPAQAAGSLSRPWELCPGLLLRTSLSPFSKQMQCFLSLSMYHCVTQANRYEMVCRPEASINPRLLFFIVNGNILSL